MAGTDNVEKGLRRGDADIAVHAFARLSAEEQPPFLERVAQLFRAAVRAEFHSQNWSKLTSWASRAEKLPGLVGPFGSSESCELHWALTWAAVATKEFERARRWYQPLHPLLTQRSPDFAAVMSAVVSGEASADVAAFLPAEPVVDPRLGYEPARKRLHWPVPTSVAEVEPTVLAMVGLEPWSVFASTIAAWAGRVSDQVRRPLWLLAGQLAAREVVRRAAANQGQVGLPAELLRQAVEALLAPPELADDALTVFRLLAAQLPPQIDSVSLAREFSHGALALCAYGAHRDLVVAVATSVKCSPEAMGPVLALLEQLLAQVPDVGVVGSALQLLATGDPTKPETTRHRPVLFRALSTVLNSDLAGTNHWFEGMAPRLRANLTEWMAFVLPIEGAQAFLTAVWPGASAVARLDLISLVESVLVRAFQEAHPEVEEPDVLCRPLANGARAFWFAVRELVLPAEPDFLVFAIVNSAPGEDLWALVECGLGPQPGVRRLLDAWDSMRRLKWVGLASAIERKLFAVHGADASALALAVLTAHEWDLPLGLKRKLAESLLAVASGAGTGGESSPNIRSAVAVASRWLTARKAPQPRAAKPARQTKASRKKKTPPPDSGSLPF